MSIEGTLDELNVADILQMVAQQRKTGILTVQGDDTIIAVSFLSGDVVAADSLQETVEDRLGEVLVREGRLTREEFTEAMEAQSVSQGRLIDLLVDQGYLSRQDVLDSLRSQTRDLLVRLMGWSSGEFKFYGNDEVAHEEGFQPIVVGELLIALLPEEEPARGSAGGEAGAPEDLDTDLGGDVFEGAFTPLPGEEDGWAGTVAASEPETAEGGDTATADPGDPGEGDPGGAGFTAQPLEDAAEADSFTDSGGDLGQVVSLPVVQREPEDVLAEGTIFVPPDDAQAPNDDGASEETQHWWSEQVAPTRRRTHAAAPEGAVDLLALLPAFLAALLVAAVILSLVTMPARFLLPLPWQDSERGQYEMAQRQAAYRTIDSAAKTFFLVEGRFPDSLDRLVEASLLHAHHLTDPAGQRLEIEAREEGYLLRPVPEDGGEPEPATVVTEAITGNFLLDPEYLNARPVDTVPPLVLLD